MNLLRRLLQRAMGVKPLPRYDLAPQPPALHSRADMDAALKAAVVPHLRAIEFKGSLPKFHHLRGNDEVG